MEKTRAAITAVGGYVPPYVLTNAELETMVDTNDEWILSRTGISERRLLKGEGLGTSDMALEAVKDLLQKRGISPLDIEVVIFATTTPDMQFPATANILSDKAGMKYIPFLFSIVFSVAASAQDFLVPYRKDTLWGYADKYGKQVSEIKYTDVQFDGDNQRWFVYLGDKMGVVNEKGHEIFPPIYDSLIDDTKHSQYNDYYVVKAGKMGYAFMNGTFCLEPVYNQLWACEYPYHRPDPYNFFISEDGNLWSVIDSSGTVFLKDISSANNLYEGNYLLKVNHKWGYYQVIDKAWKVAPVYDTIGRLYPEDGYTLTDECEGYRLFAIKGQETFLLKDDGTVTSFGNRTLGSFSRLMNPYDWSEIAVEEAIYEGDEVFSNILEAGTSGTANILRDHYDYKYRDVKLLRSAAKIGLTMNYRYESVFIEPIYDAMYIVHRSGYISQPYIVVQRNSKWGIYGLNEQHLIIPVAMDSIHYRKDGDVFETWCNGKVGVYSGKTGFGDFTTKIAPAFDDFIGIDLISSADFNYGTFRLYLFRSNGQLCAIGENGVRFFEE